MKQLKKASILLGITSLLLVGCVTSQSKPNTEKTKIDLAKYLPSKPMIKRYRYKSKTPWSKVESSSEDKIKITVNKNKISFYHEQEPISYTTVTKIDKKFITEYPDGFESDKTNRYVSVGEVTTFTTREPDNKSCVLQNVLKEFSHGKYHYSGEIIHEKCKEKRNISSKEVSIDTYDVYSKKGMGVIAIINSNCYDKNRRYTNDKDGCVSNGYHHMYYIENE